MIVAENLTKYYGDKAAVTGLDLKIDKGEVVGFLGLNGAGKTTVLRMLAGDLLPSGGRILVDGQDLAERPRDLGRWVGFLPEVPPIYPAMTVREYLYYLARLRGLTRASSEASVSAAMDKTGLRQVIDEPAGELSHGYRKRLGIAQAIVHAPKLVILDEPTSGLDPVQIVEMRGLIKSLAEDRTVLLSSHHLSEVLKGDAEKAKQVLAAIEGVESVEMEGVALEAVKLQVKANRDVRAEVARALVRAGLDILGLRRSGDDLEEVFLHVTGESRREGNANA